MSLFFSVIIPTYRRPHLLERCIHALSQQTFDKSGFEVIVVNDSLESSVTEQQIHRWQEIFPGGFSLLRQEHAGVAAARNLAIQASKGRFIAMTDDDCHPDNNWLSSFYSSIKRHRQVVGWGGKILSTTPRNFVQKYVAFKGLLCVPSRDTSGQIVNIVTANACYDRDALERIGNFKEEFVARAVAIGGEDVDLTFRIRRLGRLNYCPEAVVYHYHRDSLRALVKQHMMYGRGAYLACLLNNIPCEGLKFYWPTVVNCFRYCGYVVRRIFNVSIPEFKRKRLELSLYPAYIVLDVIRKLSFLAGVVQYHYFLRLRHGTYHPHT